jgi:pimeloyl-ACP methyl ester carboxylesterase
MSRVRAHGPSREAVVLVHGIWMARLSMVLLQQRLRRKGFETHVLSYPSLRGTPAENAARLRTLVERLSAPAVHLVGHSLGGLVILHLLAERPPPAVGRAVLLGAPVNGSAVAHLLARSWLTRHLLGRSVERGLLGEAPHLAAGRSVGVIAGTLSLGVGRVFPSLVEASDGTVTVAETHLEGASAHTTVPTSHAGLLLDGRAASATVTFLRTGRFPG